MDISNVPSAVGSPATSDTSSSSPSSVSPHGGPQGDGCHEEERCSKSLHLSDIAQQNVCGIHADDDRGTDQQVLEGNALHHDQGLNQGSLSVHDDDANSAQPVVDFSGSDVDVEKGWGSSNMKQVDGEEERPGICCRVCHLTADRSPAAGDVIKLGCACRDDLGLAHQHCAEKWFKIKGDRTCEICGFTARNIQGSRNGNSEDQWNDVEASRVGPSRAERCWQNQPLCNTLVVCVLLVLIASWLFRVTLF